MENQPPPSPSVNLPNIIDRLNTRNDTDVYGERKESFKITFIDIFHFFVFMYVPIYTFATYSHKDLVIPKYILGYFAFCFYAKVVSLKIWPQLARCCCSKKTRTRFFLAVLVINMLACMIYTFVVAEWMSNNIEMFLQMPFQLKDNGYSLFWLYTYIVLLYYYWYYSIVVYCILGFVMILACCCISCIKGVRHRRHVVEVQQNTNALNIRTVQTVFGHMQEHFFGIESCQICLVGFEDDSVVRQLPCNHFYHKECCDQWITQHGTCPTCRAKITDVVSPRQSTTNV